MSVRTNEQKKPKKYFLIRETVVASPATKDKFQDGRFIGPNCHPVQIGSLPQKISLSDLRPFPFKCSRSRVLEHVVQDVHSLG
jgi:hypothetical protein